MHKIILVYNSNTKTYKKNVYPIVIKSNLKGKNLLDNPTISKLLNLFTVRGKKNTSYKRLTNSLKYIKCKLKKNSIKYINTNINKISPSIEVTKVRKGKYIKHKPIPIGKNRQLSLSLRWLKELILSNKFYYTNKLIKEVIRIENGSSSLLKRKKNYLKYAIRNRDNINK
jgi:ribosomal protein S7